MSYVGAAANIVGGELQGWASVLEKKAMFDEFQKEQARQQGYRDQGANLFQGFLKTGGSDAASQYLQTGKAQREQSYRDVADIPLAPTSVPISQSSSPTRDKAAVAIRGQERAGLGAYGDWAFKENINNILNQESLKQLTNFAGGTAGVFPYKMYGAQHSLDDLAMIGAAISSIGGGAANYAQFAQSPQGAQQPSISNNQLYTPYNYGTTDPYTGGPMNQYLGASLALG